jgi:hypothetical protein
VLVGRYLEWGLAREYFYSFSARAREDDPLSEGLEG